MMMMVVNRIFVNIVIGRMIKTNVYPKPNSFKDFPAETTKVFPKLKRNGAPIKRSWLEIIENRGTFENTSH